MADHAQIIASLPATRRSFPPQIFSVFVNSVCYKILFLRIQGEPASLYELYLSSISTLVNFLILKYQATNETPFDTHPKTICSALVSFLLLVCFSRLKSELRSNHRVLNRCVFVCWLFTCVSLLSLMVQDSLRPVLYVLCFVVTCLESVCPLRWRNLRELWEWLNRQRVRVVRFLIEDYTRYRDQRRMVVTLPI